MSRPLLLHTVSILLAAATLAACGGRSRSEADPTPAAEVGSGWEGVIEAPPFAEATAPGSGWEDVIEAPPLAYP